MKELQKKRIFHYSIFQIEMNPKQKLNKREQKDKVQSKLDCFHIIEEENTLNTATSSVPFLICSNSKQDIPPKQERKPEIVSLHNNLSNLLKKLEVAKSKMELNYIPQELPCREKEKEYIRGFISNALESEGSATSLYISGMPGTGKTATTLEIINSFQKQNQYPSFKFIKINGMSLDKPQYVYTILWQKILSRTVKPATAAILLEEYFSNKKRSKGSLVVMLLDELDALITKRQTLLYNLFNWPAYSNSKLVIIAIANTMDLPERFLSKIKSRIGEWRLVYQPYNEEQIQTILRSKLKEEENVFSNDALKLVSWMVAKSSGDIRRSLQLCKRAIELWIEECIKDPDHWLIRSDGVQYEHINISYSELFNSKIAEVSILSKTI